MLEPESRHLLTDALRPPDGYAVDIAVATTYTLDIHSLLLAPLAMAAYDQSQAADDGKVTPLALLESVRRYAGRTTVFAQAGGIHVPGRYPRLGAFAEGCVVQVRTPTPGRVFHPKVWALRFVSPDSVHLHRVICLSRNLTGDRSWDTVLRLDEDPTATNHTDAGPLATFLTELLDLADPDRPVIPERSAQIRSLAESFRSARLAVPEPFSSATLLPFGTPSGVSWPLPAEVDDLVVISPFLDVTAVQRLPTARRITIVSRDEAFERVGRKNLAAAETWVLQPLADGAGPEDAEAATGQPDIDGEVRTGLHAKVLAWANDGIGHVITGSANCTSAAFGGNVEFSVLLEGPAGTCGTTAMLGSEDGLRRVLAPYEPRSLEGDPDARYELEREIEDFHSTLSRCGLTLRVSGHQGRFDLQLEVDQAVSGLGTTVIRPVTLTPVFERPFTDPWPSWPDRTLTELTPYVVVGTTLTRGGTTVERSCVLEAQLAGAPEDRSAQILRGLLAREEDVLRYLALLLGDPSLDNLLSRILADEDDDSEDPAKGAQGRPGFDDLVLLEPLVRAAARGDASLERAHAVLEDLRNDDGNLPQVSEAFLELWDVVWAARETK